MLYPRGEKALRYEDILSPERYIAQLIRPAAALPAMHQSAGSAAAVTNKLFLYLEVYRSKVDASKFFTNLRTGSEVAKGL